MKSILQKIVFGISISIFMAMVIVFIIWMRLPGQTLMKALIFFTPFPLVFIIGFILIRRDEKKEKNYQSQYISEMIIQDKTFGEIKFEKDSKLNRLVCKNFSKPFGAYQPPLYIEEYDETMNDFYFRNLECLYDRQEKILQAFLEATLEQANCSGKETDITVKEELQVEIYVEKCGEYFLEDTVNLPVEDDLPVEGSEFFEFQPEDWVVCVNCSSLYRFWGATPTAYMNCRTKAICYALEE